ncbi:TetR/AcrR family transcriptional regulator [Actinoplanes sp. NPDC048988]|uniref:TetR/AcrR family transcriptional regulator n=1 Tax=Actinoplanes sp. NPDC048988 TaxID=3363901 RepID=UPI003721F71E
MQKEPMPEKPMRADARRKREAIIAAAVEVFEERGVDIALDEVARRADVGIATLYRHFPTREALITGAYLHEIGRLCAGADELLAGLPADEAMKTWMRRFIGNAQGRPGLAMALKSIVKATDAEGLAAAHDEVYTALQKFLDAGYRDGIFATRVEAAVLATALSGISLASDAAGREAQAAAIIDLTVNGLRYPG